MIIAINIVPKIAPFPSCYPKTSDLPGAPWKYFLPPIKIKLLSKTHKVIRNCWHFFYSKLYMCSHSEENNHSYRKQSKHSSFILIKMVP